MTTVRGPLNAAAIPVPSSHVAVPDPASVVTTPARVTKRMRLPINSATITLSLESVVMPLGLLKVADVPMPLIEDATALPASVETIPDDVTIRTRLLKESEITRSPLEKTARLLGLSAAAVPTPSKNVDAPDPARVETTNDGEMIRIRRLR
jgi:hypothetical protein